MSLRKRCSPHEPPMLKDGTTPNPLHCPKSPKCDHFWHYDFRVNRTRYRASTETSDKHKARDIEATERTKILEGAHGIRRNAPDLTFEQFAKEYLEQFYIVNRRPASVSNLKGYLRRTLNPTFGRQLLRDITAFGIEQFKARRVAAGLKPGTINQELRAFKAILSKAVEWKRLKVSPFKSVRQLKDDAGRTRILTPDEEARLLDACAKFPLSGDREYVRARRVMSALVELLLITGARVGELLALRWSDTQGGYMRFVQTKTGYPRRIPITPRMAELLASLPRRGDFVFPRRGDRGRGRQNPWWGLTQLLRFAGIDTGDVCVHTLRHTALSRMMEAGFDTRTIMDISGHRRMEMLQRYTHPTEQRKLDALATRSQSGHKAVTTATEPAENLRKKAI